MRDNDRVELTDPDLAWEVEDISRFKERLNQLMFCHGPGNITISQAEKAACNFVETLCRMHQNSMERPEKEDV